MKRLAYFGMPVLFCAIAYVLFALALMPLWPYASAVLGMAVAEEAPDFSQALTRVFDPEAEKPKPTAKDNAIQGVEAAFPNTGEQHGQITCERIGLDAPVYWDDTDEILNVGVGQSIASLPPGYGGVIILSAHNTTFFACLEDIQEGDEVKFATNWCDYTYRVERVKVYDELVLEDLLSQKIRKEDGDEELVLYTCYPFYAISSRKTDRLCVFATRVSGTDVAWRGVD
jgi:sortase A